MSLDLMPCRSARQSAQRRPRHLQDETARQADTLYALALDAPRRGNLDRVRHSLAGLAVLGFKVENMDPGFRLVDQRRDRPDTLRLPRPDRMPLTWFVRLTRALDEGDHDLEEQALDELNRVGFGIAVNPELRKGVAR